MHAADSHDKDKIRNLEKQMNMSKNVNINYESEIQKNKICVF